MNDIEFTIKNVLKIVTDYLIGGKYKILAITISLLLAITIIYKAGKSLGEFIYYVTV
ncbi:hypothetical protein [Flavobacterium sandaracinum]|uniref:hypothetical protein n=1 Tax=Flavobacterium sandaracinum TaxID=2541733 RepID=UPI0014044040|nr:hypothetical protein [Flavobacterium sandaracinum]